MSRHLQLDVCFLYLNLLVADRHDCTSTVRFTPLRVCSHNEICIWHTHQDEQIAEYRSHLILARGTIELNMIQK